MRLRERLDRWAPGLATAGLVALLGALAARALGSEPAWLPEALLGLGGILIVSFILLRPAQVRTWLTGRQVRYGSNALLMSLAFLGILFFVNFLSNRHHQRFDLTAAKRYSLSPQTLQILRELKEPVKILGFFTPGDPRQEELKDLLEEYIYHSDKLSYEIVDPDLKPGLARQYGISSYGVLVFERGDKRQETYALDEQDITSAILKVSREEEKVVYFTTGHRERDPNGYDQRGYAQAKQWLERDNYRVETLNLAAITETLPSDAAVIVVAGPQVPFAPEEAERLRQYLDDGGKLFVLADPEFDTGLDDLLEAWGVRLRNDVVVDPGSSFFGDVLSPMVSRYRFSTITKDLGGLTSFFPGARSVEKITPSPEGRSVFVLLETTRASWGETDIEALRQRRARFDEGVDTRGPLALAVSVQASKGEEKGRLVVFGDADFASNSVLSVRGNVGNADLFRNSVNWLAEEEELIAIGPKPPDIRQIQPLTPAQLRTVFSLVVIVMPLAVLVAGGLVWWSRR